MGALAPTPPRRFCPPGEEKARAMDGRKSGDEDTRILSMPRSWAEAWPRLYRDAAPTEEKRGRGRPRKSPADERRDEKAASAFRAFRSLLWIMDRASRGARTEAEIIAATRKAGARIAGKRSKEEVVADFRRKVDDERPRMQADREAGRPRRPSRAIRDEELWTLSLWRRDDLLPLARAIVEHRSEDTSLERLAARLVAAQERKDPAEKGDERWILDRLSALYERQKAERVKGQWEPTLAYRPKYRRKREPV